jgi:hypothetical protein
MNTTHTTAKALMAMVGLTLLSSLAHAQYKDLDAEGQSQVTPSASVKVTQESSYETAPLVRKGRLTQVGVPKDQLHQVKGLGKELRFGEALKLVSPGGWKAKRVGDIDLRQAVVFGTTGTWLEAVSSFAAQTDTEIVVQWDERLLVVQPLKREVSATTGVIGGGMIQKVEDGVKVSDMKPLAPTSWALKEGKSLRENVEAWAEQAKWRVSWQGVNYMITAPAVFTGAFDDETNGPISTLFNLFAKSDVPLKATFMDDNKVLVIESVTYKQQDGKTTMR